MLCVCVFFLFFCCFSCVLCVFSFFVNKLKVCHAIVGALQFTFATTPCAYLSFVRLLKSWLLVIHFQYSPHFFGITIMEFSIANTFRMETKLNDLCVGVGRLKGCNCNNIVNRLEQEAPFEALFEALSNIGIDDLIV